MNNLGNTAPDYGFGAGPVYLSGQTGWYSAGQAAELMVDPKYNGPLTVRAVPFDTASTSQITLSDQPPITLANIAAKERQHSVAVIPAVHTSDGTLRLRTNVGSPTWRAWEGSLSTSGAGCFALHVNGSNFSEVIVIDVHGGPPSPG